MIGEKRMKHKFKVVNKSKLDSPKRREALPVKEILKTVEVEPSEVVADIGCGIGYFTFALSETVGNGGLVYAMDIEPEMLEDIKSRVAESDIKNIIPIITKEYELTLEDNSVGTALLCTVMHEIKMREKFLREANRILRSDGKIIIIEWIKKDSDYGPPTDHRLDKNILKRNLMRTEFKEVDIMDFNEYFYIVRAKKK